MAQISGVTLYQKSFEAGFYGIGWDLAGYYVANIQEWRGFGVLSPWAGSSNERDFWVDLINQKSSQIQRRNR